MFQFTGYPAHSCEWLTILSHGGIAPFGNRRVKRLLTGLPAISYVYIRPSSAQTSKASSNVIISPITYIYELNHYPHICIHESDVCDANTTACYPPKRPFLESICLFTFDIIINGLWMCGHRIQLLAASYKNRILSLVAKSFLVDPTGLEPVSSSLQMKCSTNWTMGPHASK